MGLNPVDQLMREGLRTHVFPGAVLLVGKGNDVLFFEAYGKANLFSGRSTARNTFFDLASLTKPLATTLAIAKLADQRLLSLDEPVVEWLPSLFAADKKKITIRHLLNHTSGLPAHRPYYMILRQIPLKKRKASVLESLRSTPLESLPGIKHRYSDLGFMVLCRVVERVTLCTLDRFLKTEIYEPMGLADLFFVDLTVRSRPDFSCAATELCPVRNRLLIGEVHDDNAWFTGGVDGHAGLFGNGTSVYRLLRGLVDHLNGRVSPAVFSPKILSELFQLENPSNFALGFDRPAKERSSAGTYFSNSTVGHLGFTGVSFWLDLVKDTTVILLTNRVHPTRWNNRLVDFRPRIHNEIMEHFEIVSN